MSGRILCVDDEDIVIRSCRRVLADGEFEVEAVQNGIEALKKVDDGNFDVVILDIMMPKMDGIEVLQRVKESHPDLEVIMITGLSQVETAVKSMTSRSIPMS